MFDQSTTTTPTPTPEQRHAAIVKAVEAAKTLGADPSIEQQMGVTLLDKAVSLKEERERNTAQTAANRDMLRGMATQKLLTDAQASAVSAIYPAPTRRAEAATTPATTEKPAETPAETPDAPKLPAASGPGGSRSGR